jgi:hypothetical protein
VVKQQLSCGCTARRLPGYGHGQALKMARPST